MFTNQIFKWPELKTASCITSATESVVHQTQRSKQREMNVSANDWKREAIEKIVMAASGICFTLIENRNMHHIMVHNRVWRISSWKFQNMRKTRWVWFSNRILLLNSCSSREVCAMSYTYKLLRSEISEKSNKELLLQLQNTTIRETKSNCIKMLADHTLCGRKIYAMRQYFLDNCCFQTMFVCNLCSNLWIFLITYFCRRSHVFIAMNDEWVEM